MGNFRGEGLIEGGGGGGEGKWSLQLRVLRRCRMARKALPMPRKKTFGDSLHLGLLVGCGFGSRGMGAGGLDVVVPEVDGKLVDGLSDLQRFVMWVAFLVLAPG